jgi:hypothetical protein
MIQPGREIRTWFEAENGSRSPFQGSGIRLPLDSGCWIAVDFRGRVKGQVSVAVGVRAQEAHVNRLPRLQIVPLAGNSASVVFENTAFGPDSIAVVPVDESELSGDIRGWLAKTTSGDPLGEVVLAREHRPTLPARRLVLAYGDLAEVHVCIRSTPDAAVVDVRVVDAHATRPRTPFESLGMSLFLHASNLVSFNFREARVSFVE